MSPLLAFKILAIVLSIVDLPHPFAPMIVVIFPFGISKFKSSTIFTLP